MITESEDKPAPGRSPVFKQIAGQPGGAKGALLNDEVLIRAQARLQDLAPLVEEELRTHIAAIEAVVLSGAQGRELFDRAHQVRGIAGTFGFREVGVICGALCDYGHDAPPGFAPDANLVQSLVRMLAYIFAHPGQLSLAEVTTYSRDAVAKIMKRECR